MVKSIRLRLQLWYGAVLVAVVAGFAAVLYWEVRSARVRDLDAELELAVAYVQTEMRPIPPWILEGMPEPQFPPMGPDGRPGRGGFEGRGEGRGDWRGGPGGRGGPDGRPPGSDGRGGPRPGPRFTREEMFARLNPGDVPGLYVGIWREDGGVLRPPETPAAPGASPSVAWVGTERRVTATGPRNTRILVGKNADALFADLRTFTWTLAGTGASVLALGLAGGWFVSRRIFRPVAAITQSASRISATNLDERIDESLVDSELRDLAGVLNDAFDRLQSAFDRQQQFTADASHELRTPLAVIRSHADLALAKPRTAEEYVHALTACRTAAGRMTTIVQGLLLLARADAGRAEMKRDPVPLDRVAEEAVALLKPLAKEQGIAIGAKCDPVTVLGDRTALAQVVGNLVENAIRYNKPRGEVRVRVTERDGSAEIEVSDTGIGIPADDLPHVFDRFYRVDKARARASGGTGLGLAIVRTLVEAHGGTVAVESTPDVGTTVRVRLPFHSPVPTPAPVE